MCFSKEVAVPSISLQKLLEMISASSDLSLGTTESMSANNDLLNVLPALNHFAIEKRIWDNKQLQNLKLVQKKQ